MIDPDKTTWKDIYEAVKAIHPSKGWRDWLKTLTNSQIAAIYHGQEKKIAEKEMAKQNDICEAFPEAITPEMKQQWLGGIHFMEGRIRRALNDILERYEAQCYNYENWPDKYVKPDWGYVEEEMNRVCQRLK